MKRFILIEILLTFILIMLLVVSIGYWSNLNSLLHYFQNHLQDSVTWNQFTIDYGFTNTLILGIFSTLAAIADIAVIVIIAVKDFKPVAERINARKEKRAQAKAEREAADKQARIEALEAELEELKKD